MRWHFNYNVFLQERLLNNKAYCLVLCLCFFYYVLGGGGTKLNQGATSGFAF